MIKLATMTSVCPDWDLPHIIDAMQEYGYDGLEPRVGWGHSAGIELTILPGARSKIRRCMDDAGLAIPCIATGAKFSLPDDDEARQSMTEAKEAISLAEDLGAPFVRTFGGPRGDGEVRGMVHRTAERYRRVVDIAAKHGVTLLMETHDYWCVSAQVRAVIEEVDNLHLRALWDIAHPQRVMERPEETMSNIGRYTAHVHAHDVVYDEKGRTSVTALGDGVFDHSTPLRLLGESGFDGYCSVEIIHKPGSDHDARGVMAQYARGLKALI